MINEAKKIIILSFAKTLNLSIWKNKMAHFCNHKWKADRFDCKRRGAAHETTDAEIGRMWPQAKQCWQIPEAERSEGWISPGPSDTLF